MKSLNKEQGDMHNIPESLPLFSDLEPVRGGRGGKGIVRNRNRNRPVNRHLRAARRLSRAVRKLPDYSEEQTRAGQAICRHLLALLEEAAEQPSDSTPKDA